MGLIFLNPYRYATALAAPSVVQDKPLAQAVAADASFTFDSALTEGNRMVVVVMMNGGTSNIDTPAGWDRDLDTSRGAAGPTLAFFSKDVGPAESETVTITFNGGTWARWAHGFEVSNTGVKDKSTSATSAGATSLSTGSTAATLDATEFMVAAVGTGGSDGSVVTWTNSFVSEDDQSFGSAASRISTTAGVKETTASWLTSRAAVVGLVTYRNA